ncbi:hypothetical protein LH464_04180 [Neorhizobium sp. T786]|uniref:hypothetical protein n=1 Tax=Pseudorhizobium xiangyangii TaxID=2883104 RepID=UPI001CFFD779|nr:hypothetical protein [Neorhizobium xiangyangii]MCB5201675.1 hypothetical protein [Neorhizobium xiangyangii]
MAREIFTTRLEVTERHDRAVVANYGLPSRPVIIPLAGVDFEPDGGRFYKATMSRETAKEYRLDI